MASDNICESCLFKEKFAVAVQLCADCDERLCEECSVNHLGFKAFKLHHIILLKLVPANISTFTKSCLLHEDVMLDFYCTQHEKSCCRICIPESHQSCKHVLPLEGASKDVKESSLLTDTFDELNNIIDTFEKLLKFNNDNIDRLNKSGSLVLQMIAVYKSRLIKQLDDLEQQLTHEVMELQTNLKRECERISIDCVKKKAESENTKHELEFLKEHGTDNQLFLALQTFDTEIRETETEIREMISTCQKIDIKYEHQDSNLKTLGTISRIDKPCELFYTSIKLKQAQIKSHLSPKFLSKFKREGEIHVSHGNKIRLFDIAMTDDNKLLLVNVGDPKVYIYTDLGKFEGELTFSCSPDVIAVIPGKNKAVVTLPDEKSMMFVNTETMTKEDNIKLEFEPTCATASPDIIYIGGFKSINVFDTNGIMQKTIAVSGIDCAYFIKLSKNSTEILCKDRYTFYSIDFDGNILYRHYVGGVGGIAVDRHGDVFVGHYYHSKVFRMSPNGECRDVILTYEDGINHPSAMTFNNDCSKLFIISTFFERVFIFYCK